MQYKGFLYQKVQSWDSKEIVEQIEVEKRFDKITIDVRVSVVKTLHEKWILKFYNYIGGKAQLERIKYYKHTQ